MVNKKIFAVLKFVIPALLARGKLSKYDKISFQKSFRSFSEPLGPLMTRRKKAYFIVRYLSDLSPEWFKT